MPRQVAQRHVPALRSPGTSCLTAEEQVTSLRCLTEALFLCFFKACPPFEAELDAPEFIEHLRPSDLSVDILSICRPIPTSVQVLWPQQTIANFVYKCFPDLFLRTKEGARVPIPLLEDLVNRERSSRHGCCETALS